MLAGLCSLIAACSDVFADGAFVLAVAGFLVTALFEADLFVVLGNDTRASASWL